MLGFGAGNGRPWMTSPHKVTASWQACTHGFRSWSKHTGAHHYPTEVRGNPILDSCHLWRIYPSDCPKWKVWDFSPPGKIFSIEAAHTYLKKVPIHPYSKVKVCSSHQEIWRLLLLTSFCKNAIWLAFMLLLGLLNFSNNCSKKITKIWSIRENQKSRSAYLFQISDKDYSSDRAITKSQEIVAINGQLHFCLMPGFLLKYLSNFEGLFINK